MRAYGALRRPPDRQLLIFGLKSGTKAVAFDDEARKKLFDKINRIASNLGVDEVIAAAVQQHPKTIGEIPADEPGEADGEAADMAGADLAGLPEFMREANAPEASHAEAQPSSGFFTRIDRNALKNLD
jgi:hypothetical protein